MVSRVKSAGLLGLCLSFLWALMLIYVAPAYLFALREVIGKETYGAPAVQLKAVVSLWLLAWIGTLLLLVLVLVASVSVLRGAGWARKVLRNSVLAGLALQGLTLAGHASLLTRDIVRNINPTNWMEMGF